MKSAFMLTVCFLFFTACAIFGGDMPIRISGMVPDLVSGVSRTDCELVLVQAGTGQIKSRREIAAGFSTSFVVEARPKAYYFVAECLDGQKFHSQKITFGDDDTFNQLFELELTPEDQM